MRTVQEELASSFELAMPVINMSFFALAGASIRLVCLSTKGRNVNPLSLLHLSDLAWNLFQASFLDSRVEIYDFLSQPVLSVINILLWQAPVSAWYTSLLHQFDLLWNLLQLVQARFRLSNVRIYDGSSLLHRWTFRGTCCSCSKLNFRNFGISPAGVHGVLSQPESPLININIISPGKRQHPLHLSDLSWKLYQANI